MGDDEPTRGGLAFLIETDAPAADFRADVLAGLAQPQKSIPPKYFYDEAGAAIFEEICLTPEYYVTRAEAALLQRSAGEIAARAGSGATLFEPGSGAAEKARILLAEFAAPNEYILFDISREQLEAAGEAVAAAFPGLRIGAVAGDFTTALPDPDAVFTGEGRRVCFFPGGTLGNFDPGAQCALLKRFRTMLRPGDGILVGVDAIKDAARLDAAYNDAAGRTAAFNLNLLRRMARELGAIVDVDAFEHAAFFNPSLGRIEMHLFARRETRIEVADGIFDFRTGETIHTENSWKFNERKLTALAADCGLELVELWRAPGDDFLLAWLGV